VNRDLENSCMCERLEDIAPTAFGRGAIAPSIHGIGAYGWSYCETVPCKVLEQADFECDGGE